MLLDVITDVLMRGRQRGILSRRGRGTVALETETLVVQPRARESWKPPEVARSKYGLALEPLKGAQTCQCLDFGLVILISVGQPPELCVRENCVCFKPLEFVFICYSGRKKRTQAVGNKLFLHSVLFQKYQNPIICFVRWGEMKG